MFSRTDQSLFRSLSHASTCSIPACACCVITRDYSPWLLCSLSATVHILNIAALLDIAPILRNAADQGKPCVKKCVQEAQKVNLEDPLGSISLQHPISL